MRRPSQTQLAALGGRDGHQKPNVAESVVDKAHEEGVVCLCAAVDPWNGPAAAALELECVAVGKEQARGAAADAVYGVVGWVGQTDWHHLAEACWEAMRGGGCVGCVL